MIGNALYLMYKAAGYTVHRINFLGDWGTAFGRLIAGSIKRIAAFKKTSHQ